jgi:hypothetical protein
MGLFSKLGQLVDHSIDAGYELATSKQARTAAVGTCKITAKAVTIAAKAGYGAAKGAYKGAVK